MNDLSIQTNTTSLIGSVMGRALSPPVETREIILLQTHIAGTAYYNLGKYYQQINNHDALTLTREKTNKYDDLAIKVTWHDTEKQPRKIGYISRRHNPILARLMDAGKQLKAEIIELENRGEWVEPLMQISLVENL